MGLVEVLVSVALLAVAVTALLGTSGTILVGANTAERRTVEQRLARNQLEKLQNGTSCNPSSSESIVVDHTTYAVSWISDCPSGNHPHYVEYKVTVSDPSGSYSLSADRWLS